MSTGHSWHDDFPLVSSKVPAAHVSHSPSLLPYLPRSHELHDLVAPLSNSPNLHLVHSSAALESEYQPVGQSVQMPSLLPYLPRSLEEMKELWESVSGVFFLR